MYKFTIQIYYTFIKRSFKHKKYFQGIAQDKQDKRLRSLVKIFSSVFCLHLLFSFNAHDAH